MKLEDSIYENTDLPSIQTHTYSISVSLRAKFCVYNFHLNAFNSSIYPMFKVLSLPHIYGLQMIWISIKKNLYTQFILQLQSLLPPVVFCLLNNFTFSISLKWIILESMDESRDVTTANKQYLNNFFFSSSNE